LAKIKRLAKNIYITFGDSINFGFRDQILRASVSVMNNIAEGFERKSNTEFKHFLYISKGSCGEVRSMLTLASELQKIDEENYLKLFALSEGNIKNLVRSDQNTLEVKSS
jgi:four helix bundle protein